MEKKILLKKIAEAQKGGERRAVIENNDTSSITKIGSNVTLFTTSFEEGASFEEKLEKTYLLLINRRNHDGSFDGYGALGGLSESISQEEFSALSLNERKKLLGKIDNVTIKDGKPELTDNQSVISLKNVQRELSEELADIKITDFQVDWDKIKKTPIEPKDTDFLLNRWDGNGEVFIVTPQCYIMPVEEEQIDELIAKSKDSAIEDNSEVLGLSKVSLKEALKAFGTDKNYRYAHEYLVSLFVAAEVLNQKEKVALFEDFQTQEGVGKALKTAKITPEKLKKQFYNFGNEDASPLIKSAKQKE